ncbi:hypothetical protein [Nonomuraea sp. NPDC050783]|uniref:hypothetical protein n=1 Tax=Nonomuraea sp. NPDC050783 TaxID=3154634 RepID=UPI003465A1FA
MTSLTKKLLGALATATLAGTALAATAALPAAAAPAARPAAPAAAVRSGALFDGFGKGADEGAAAAAAESAARRNAADHGFTACEVFESVLWQNAGSSAWLALVTVRCEDAAR